MIKYVIGTRHQFLEKYLPTGSEYAEVRSIKGLEHMMAKRTPAFMQRPGRDYPHHPMLINKPEPLKGQSIFVLYNQAPVLHEEDCYDYLDNDLTGHDIDQWDS